MNLGPYEPDNIYKGDCIELMKALPGGCINMILTDPPYGHGNHAGDLNAKLNKHRGIKDKPILNDTQEEFRAVFDEMLTEAARVLCPDCCCCCCCCGGGGGPRPTFAYVADRMDSKGMEFFHSVIWDKLNPGLGWRYRRQHEMIMIAHRKGGKLSWNEKETPIGNIIRMAAPKNRLHPNEKPLLLMKDFILRHTKEGDLILDPFIGSGTTAIAAHKTGRKYIGFELSDEYFDIAQNRIRDETAQMSLEL